MTWNCGWLLSLPFLCFQANCKCKPAGWTGCSRSLVPESELRNGTLDCAIGYFPDARHLAPDLIMEPLSEENSVVISRRGHSMWKRKLTLHRFTMLDHAA